MKRGNNMKVKAIVEGDKSIFEIRKQRPVELDHIPVAGEEFEISLDRLNALQEYVAVVTEPKKTTKKAKK